MMDVSIQIICDDMDIISEKILESDNSTILLIWKVPNTTQNEKPDEIAVSFVT